MDSRIIASSLVVCLLACTSDAEVDDAVSDASTADATTDEIGDGDHPGDGDGDHPGDGDGDGDDETGPAELPTPTSACPTLTTGNVQLSPANIDPRTVKVWAPTQPSAGGALVIYWHAYTSNPDEALLGLSPTIIDEITAEGGVVVAPYPAADVGQFPWFAVNGSPRQDDMILADEIVACAVQELDIDPRRIHSVGMSAGGMQTSYFAMARSRYIASVSTYSGGVIGAPAFEDPSNRFAAMIFHGGDSDVFGGAVNFKTLSLAWLNQLHGNGNFAFVCDHGNGHTLPPSPGPSVWAFFQAHPFGTEPSPYQAGLPASLPSYCAL
jgi:hypothetical protein